MSPSAWDRGSFGNDELGEVSRLFNLFMDKLQEILRGVVAHTHKLSTASQQAARGQPADHYQFRRDRGPGERRFPRHAAGQPESAEPFRPAPGR